MGKSFKLYEIRRPSLRFRLQWIWLAIDGRWPRYANKKLEK
ncbi:MULTISPECIES: hypothetical protein [Moorena]|nr:MULTISPECIES: hypothetical protein [Moorena]